MPHSLTFPIVPGNMFNSHHLVLQCVILDWKIALALTKKGGVCVSNISTMQNRYQSILKICDLHRTIRTNAATSEGRIKLKSCLFNANANTASEYCIKHVHHPNGTQHRTGNDTPTQKYDNANMYLQYLIDINQASNDVLLA